MQNLFQLISVLMKWSKSIRHSRSMMFLTAACGVIAGLSSTALIVVINTALSGSAPKRTLMWQFSVLCIVIPLSGFASQYALFRLTSQAARDLRLQMFRQILAVPYRHLEELGTHRLLATITDDIPVVTAAFTSLPLLGTQFAVITGCLVYLGWLSWPLLVLGIVWMLFGILTHQWPLSKSVHYFQNMREQWDAVFKGVRALTEGAKELKLNRARRNAFFSQQLQPAVDQLQYHVNRANGLSLIASNWGQMQFFMFIGLLLFVVPMFLLASRPALTGYTLTALFMMGPLSIVLNTMPTLGRAYAAARKINEMGLSLTSQPAEIAEISGASPELSWRRLDMTGVTHTYRENDGVHEFQLGPLDLTLYPGELVFLIGGNGSGKTTLAKLLLGLYEPLQGEILLDGNPVTLKTRDDYRQYFSVIFSDFYLFDRLFGLSNPDLEKKGREHLVQLQLDHKVRIDKDKLSTVDLSQGQKKRLALLTAYLEDRPIYVFDEWASDQDPMFKQVFYYQILSELKARGKTVIVISHDDRYYHLADRIIKLERGQIEYDKRQAAGSGVAQFA